MKKWLKRILFFLIAIFVLLNIMSAFHAYKFTHFYDNVQKVNAPEKMGFGSKLSSVFFGVKFPKSKIVELPTRHYENIEIKTEDGLKLKGWFIKADSTSKGTVIMFHGHGSSRSGIVTSAEKINSLGWNVFLIDFRAHGESEGNTSTIGVKETKDVKAAYAFIESNNEKNIVLYGVSLGASTILKAVKDEGLQPSKLILEMPFGTLLEAIEGRMKTMGLPPQPLSSLLAFWGGVEQGFWAFNHEPQEYAKSINCPVLLQWGLNDPRVTQKETETIFNNIPIKEKKLVIYNQCAHQNLFKKEPEKWVANISEFLK
jgi:alpha-beta hydrolase superfamily lysophospholipase